MLLKKKIIASSIANLTDARYFAGWMVDYLVFNIDPDHEFYTAPQDIGSFQSWVSGPEYILQMSHQQLENAEKYLVDLNCQWILIDFKDRDLIKELEIPKIYRVDWSEYQDNIEDWESYNTPIILCGMDSLEDQLSQIRPSNEIDMYIEIAEQSTSSELLLDESIQGFLVHGSPEEKVGFKSFDQLDEIFEILQDF